MALISVLFWVTHQPMFTAGSLDPVRAGDVPGETRAVLWVNEGLRYRVHVKEGAADPGSCDLETPRGTHPLRLDPDRHDGDEAAAGGYRWLGAFRSPVDGYGAVSCDRSSRALRVHVDAPGFGTLLLLLAVWPLILIWSAVLFWRGRRRARRTRTERPADPPAAVSPAAMAAGDRAQTAVYFRNGTFVPAGRRDRRAATAFAVERLAAPRDTRGIRIAVAADGGRLVTFPDLAVYLAPDEIKHFGAPGLGRHALAKIGLDARDPEVTHVRPADPLRTTPG